jgi:radical SAM enzyme (TIGR01210 family)
MRSTALPPPAELDSWIVDHRGLRNRLDPFRANAQLVETERSAEGELVPVATIFLSAKECPIRCLVCDLWKNALEEPVPPGAVPRQIERALSELPPARQVKLYNAGSFFDPAAIPPEDREPIARLVRRFERVIVESHPSFVGPAVQELAGAIDGQLEVALGLETIHPEIFPLLNKRTTVAAMEKAARQLLDWGVDFRAFVLVGLPWCSEEESIEWAVRSTKWALERGATAVSLIPARGGNGATDELARLGEFAEPSLATIEKASAQALGSGSGRVFVDPWDLARFASCPRCLDPRLGRLERQNLGQRSLPPVRCSACGQE